MKAREYFKSHPQRLEVFETTDGFLFPQESDAKNHQRNVDAEKTVKRHQNAGVETTTAITTVETVEKVIGADEHGNIVGDKVTHTAEVTKVVVEDTTEAVVQALEDKATPVAVEDVATKEVKVTDDVTGKETVKETATVQAKSKTAKAATKKA